MHLLDCMKFSTLNGNSFTQWSLSGENEVLYGRIAVWLSHEQLGNSTKYIIHWNWDIKILINYVHMSAYRHLKYLPMLARHMCRYVNHNNTGALGQMLRYVTSKINYINEYFHPLHTCKLVKQLNTQQASSFYIMI